LDRDSIDDIVGIGIESSIKCSIGIETSDTVAGDSTYCCKISTNEDLSITLDFYHTNLCPCGYIRIKSSIEGSVGIETSDTIASDSSDCRECSSDDDLPIGLYG
jgi:hypothetical protein